MSLEHSQRSLFASASSDPNSRFSGDFVPLMVSSIHRLISSFCFEQNHSQFESLKHKKRGAGTPPPTRWRGHFYCVLTKLSEDA
jgi:hypothetical protein